VLCRQTGGKVPPRKLADGQVQEDWYRCAQCGSQWQAVFVSERNDLVFRTDELISAQSQMRLLGADSEVRPNTVRLIEDHYSVPPGYDARMILLREEPLPRTALYFRWDPRGGQKLSPDLVFQCKFGPEATAAERKAAPEAKLSPEQFEYLTRKNFHEQAVDGHVISFTGISCQHCLTPIPLRALNTLTLRRVEKGD
jgi:hypothetical protein